MPASSLPEVQMVLTRHSYIITSEWVIHFGISKHPGKINTGIMIKVIYGLHFWVPNHLQLA